EPTRMEPLLRAYLGGRRTRVVDGPSVEEINRRFRAHYREGFHVRLKRAYEVRVGTDGMPANETVRVVAKSVGYGWLGYHAYPAASRLAGRFPPLVGLRHGMLITAWRGDPDRTALRVDDTDAARAVAGYVARRVRRLALREDPCFDSVGYRWTGWD